MSITKEAKALYDQEYRAKNRARLAEKNRAYALANPERVKTAKQAWADANRERSAEIKKDWKLRNPGVDKAYYEANKEARQARTKAYVAANKPAVSARLRAYLQRPEVRARNAANKVAYRARRPEVHLATSRTRRHGVSYATPVWANREAIKSIYTKARATGMQVDHVVPLKGALVSGLHVPGNLQLLTRKDNQMKGNSHAS